MNIPEDYDGTDDEGEPVCDCPACGVLNHTWQDYEPTGDVLGRDLFRAQIEYHRAGQQSQRAWRHTPNLDDWYVNYSALRLAQHTNSLHNLFAYRRRREVRL